MKQQRLECMDFWKQWYRYTDKVAPGDYEWACKKLAQILGRSIAAFGKTFETASEEELARIWHWMQYDQIWPVDEPLEIRRAAA